MRFFEGARPAETRLYNTKLTPSALQDFLLGAILLKEDVEYLECLYFPDGAYLHRFQKNGALYNLICPTKDFKDEHNPNLPEFHPLMEKVEQSVFKHEIKMGVISQVAGQRNHFASFFGEFYLETKSFLGLYPLDEFLNGTKQHHLSPSTVIKIGQQALWNDVACGWHAISNLLHLLDIPQTELKAENIEIHCQNHSISRAEINSVTKSIGAAMRPCSEKHHIYFNENAPGGNSTSYTLKFSKHDFIRTLISDQTYQKAQEAHLSLSPASDWQDLETSSTESFSEASQTEPEDLNENWVDADEKTRGSLKNSLGQCLQKNLHIEIEPISQSEVEHILQSPDNIDDWLNKIGIKDEARREIGELIEFYREHYPNKASLGLTG